MNSDRPSTDQVINITMKGNVILVYVMLAIPVWLFTDALLIPSSNKTTLGASFDSRDSPLKPQSLW